MANVDRDIVSDRLRFRWDVLIFVVFVASAAPNLTGIPIHEWLGLALPAIALVHLLFNWRWIIDVSRRMFRTLPGKIRFNHLWDALLFVLLILVTLSGVLISKTALPMLGLNPMNDDFWREIHDTVTTLLMIAVGVHLGMHLSWIIKRLTRRRGAAAAEKLAEDLA